MEAMNDLSVKAKKTRILPAEEIRQKYYSGVPYDVFTQIVSADVVSSNLQKHKLGKYAKWMLHLYGKNHLKVEDLYKVQEYIPVFDKATKANKLREKDVNCYKSLADMYVAVEPFLEKQTISNKEEIRHIKEHGAEKLYEDETFTVIHPMTEAASCFYGKGTQWCTAAAKISNAFKSYNYRGKLYIIIDKIKNRKYQFHLESMSFCDEQDASIKSSRISSRCKSVLATLDATYGLIHFFNQEINNINLYCDGFQCDVIDGTLIIFKRNGRYGIRKIDEVFYGCFDFDDAYQYSEVLLDAEFDGIARYTEEKEWRHSGVFIVIKEETRGVYNYYTNSIRWKDVDNEFTEQQQQLLRKILLPSDWEFRLTIPKNIVISY
jgi:hypothetical protein